jgi:hypothetical protein
MILKACHVVLENFACQHHFCSKFLIWFGSCEFLHEDAHVVQKAYKPA